MSETNRDSKNEPIQSSIISEEGELLDEELDEVTGGEGNQTQPTSTASAIIKKDREIKMSVIKNVL